jgi:hypothetical protein
MAFYIVTGKLGSGKTLACVGRIRDALLAGRRVATNLDLHLHKMLPSDLPRADVIRVADKPTLADLQFIGNGTEEYDESKFGLLVLDELGAWFNSRGWQDPSRQKIIDWLLHSRKHGWDVYLIIQHPKMLDAQAREGLAEMVVTCRRLDRIRLPFVGGLFKTLTGVHLTLPKVHIGTVRYGLEHGALVCDRWVYQAKDLYAAYDTRQVFTDLVIPAHRLPWLPAVKFSFRAWLNDFFFAVRPANPFPLKSRSIIVARIMKLPPDKRMYFYNRFASTGAL